MSSPIAHTAAAYAIYSAFRRRLPEEPVLGVPHRLAWPLIVTFLSLLPDLDVIAAMTMGGLEKFHNNLSHSLIVCTLASFILALLLKFIAKSPLKTGLLLAITCCLSHILIDFFTRGRGIMLFWPFVTARYQPPFLLFVGVPWSYGLMDPMYLVMILNDLLFAAIVVGLVEISKRKLTLYRVRLLLCPQMSILTERILKSVAALLLLGLLFGAWWSYQQSQVRNIPILMYHRIGNEGNSVWWVHLTDFENHLDFLNKQGYESILPSDLVSHRRWGKPLPAKPVIFTFDDGYMNSLVNAEPLLKKYGFRGIVYLVTGKVAETAADRKQMEGTPALIWPEIREMQSRGTLTFGGHTRNHVNLAATPDPYPEIHDCYRDIRKKGGFIPAGFCYPNGEYRTTTLPEVARAGFATAVTCKGGFFETRHPTSLLELPRLSVYGGTHIYHVESVPTTNDTSVITLKVWKDGCRVCSIPRFAAEGMKPEDGWLDPIAISKEPTTIAWHLPKGVTRPISFQLWGDMKLLPHWQQKVQ